MIFKNYQELSSHLKNLPQVILVYGSQFENLEKIFNQLEKDIKEKIEEAESVSLNGTETEPSTFHAELTTIPMFGNPRIILVRHGDALLKKIDQNKTILNYFLRDLDNLFEKTFLILQVDSAKPPASFKKSFENAYILEESKIRARDLPDVIKSRVHAMNFEIEETAIIELTRKYSLNPSLINKALDRLFLFCLNEKKIFKNDIIELSFDSEGDFLFEIIDAVAERNTTRAIRLLEKSDLSNVPGFMSVLSKFFTDTYRYLKLSQLQTGIKEIHERLELNINHSFIFRKNEERFRQAIILYKENNLISILDDLYELDKGIKENSSVELQKNLILMFIVSIEKKAG